MESYSKETGQVDVLTEYLAAGLDKKSYCAWVRTHFAKKFTENTLIASTKTKLYCSAKEMIIAIQNTKIHHSTKPKIMAWLTTANKQLNQPIELPLYSELNGEVTKNLFKALNLSINLYYNIGGYDYLIKKQIEVLLESKIQFTCVNILSQLGINLDDMFIKYSSVPEESAKELFSKYNLDLWKSLENNNFCVYGESPFYDKYNKKIKVWPVLFILAHELWK